MQCLPFAHLVDLLIILSAGALLGGGREGTVLIPAASRVAFEPPGNKLGIRPVFDEMQPLRLLKWKTMFNTLPNAVMCFLSYPLPSERLQHVRVHAEMQAAGTPRPFMALSETRVPSAFLLAR